VSAHSIALFLHVVGVLALFAGIGLEQTGLRRLRHAVSAAQAREWATLLRGQRRIDAPAGLAILVTGGYLAETGAGHHAWVAIGILGLVTMAILGMAVSRPRVAAIAAMLSVIDGPIPSAIADRLRDPVLRASAALRAALAVGIVFDMVVKPGTAGALAALIVALVVGAAASLAGGNGRRSAVVASE
jgi:hypothetical protein